MSRYLIKMMICDNTGVVCRYFELNLYKDEYNEYRENPEKWLEEQVRKYLIARMLKV